MKIKINREELCKLYMQQVDDICEECDWVTSFGPQEIIHMISDIIEFHPEIIEHESK
jgi:hypothetical protein